MSGVHEEKGYGLARNDGGHPGTAHAATLRRRGEPRFRRRLRVLMGSGGDQHVGFTLDVSEHGLFVATNHLPVTQRTALGLMVELPSGERVALEGTVRWIRDTPQQLAGISRRGFGLVLSEPPGSWRSFVASLG